jgi:predicted RNase H-like HicB family nuclease
VSTDSDSDRDAPTGTTITLTREDDWWVAKDEQTGVASQGKSRQAALENLDEALEGYHGEGEVPSENDLRELGINPEQNTSGSLDDSDIFESTTPPYPPTAV